MLKNRKILFILLLIAPFFTAAGRQVNIFPDGNFENQKIHYRYIGNVRGTAMYDSVNVAEGKFSLKVANSTKGNARGYSGQIIHLNQTKAAPLTISYKGMRKGTGSTVAAVDLVITYDNGQRIYFFRGLELPGDTGGKWISRKSVLKPARPIKTIEVWPIVNGDVCTAWFDDIKIMTEESSFAVEKNKEFVAENGDFRMVFGDYGNIFSLIELENRQRKNFFVSKSVKRVPVNLWNISFLLNNKRIVSVEQGKISKITANKTANLYYFDWNDLPIPGTKSKFNVRVTLDLRKTVADWRIEVKSSENIYNVTFPRINGIGKLGKQSFDDYVAIPDRSGVLLQDYSKVGTVNLIYGAGAPMQFSAFYDPNGGLYMSTYDASMLTKSYSLARQLDNSLLYQSVVVPGMQKEYKQAFPFVMQFFDGDWFDAAGIYRKWAVKQFWCTDAGRLIDRKNPLVDSIHAWIKGGAYNAKPYTYPVKNVAAINRLTAAERLEYAGEIAAAATAGELVKLAEATGKDATAVWFTDNWHTGGCFGITPTSPEYQARKGFSAMNALLQKENLPIMPYVNFGRYDVMLAGYSEADMIRNFDLQVRTYPAHGIAQGAICHASKNAKKLWDELAVRIASYGCSGIYLDELSTNGNPVCYASNHDHAAGDSTAKMRAQRANVISMKKAASAICKNYFTMGEQGAEVYIGANDINIWWKSSEGDGDIPLFEAVYHDYSIGMGRVPGKWYGKHMEKGYPDPRGNVGIEEFMLNTGKSFVHGLQLGIIRQDMKKYSPEAVKYLRDMIVMRKKLAVYMHYGQLLRPAELLYPTEKISVKQSFLGFQSVPSAIVLNGAFKADDGSVANVFLNISGTEMKFYYSVSPVDDWNLDSGNYELTAITPAGEHKIGVLKAEKNKKYTFSLTAPAFAPVAVVWKKTSAAPSANIGNEKVPIKKTTVEILPRMSQIKAGDSIFFDGRIKNTADADLKLTLKWLLPEKWQIINAPSAITVKKGDEFRFSAEISSSRSMTNSQKKIVLSIPELDKSFDFQFEEQLPRKEFAVYKGSKSVIDAMRSCTFNIDSAFTHIELQLPERNSNLQLANASAKGICRYDDSGLHFLFQVKGVKHFPAPHSSDIWKGSCMQFALNGRRLDQPYALSLAAAKTTENIAVWDFFAGKFIKNVKFNWKNVGNIQYYYMAIPWKILSFDKIPIGKKISFSATYNNSNGKEFAGYLEWTRGICNGTLPNEYGNLVICE